MSPKNRKRGVLTGMVKYPKSGSSKKKEGPFQRLLVWLGWGLIGLVLLVLFFSFLYLTFNPQMARKGEGSFVVDRVEENPPGYLPQERIVAVAVVTIERRVVRIPMTEEKRRGVEKGKKLHVRYEFRPRMGLVKPESWELLP